MKKKIIITLSRVFPTTHSKAGKPTYFREKVIKGQDNYSCIYRDFWDKTTPKIHTIRENYDRWVHNIDKINEGRYYLSVREWSGKPYGSKQIEIIEKHAPIGIQRIELYYHAENDTITAKIDGREWIDADCAEIAKNDGLSIPDFKEWFFGREPKEDKVFRGVIIHFTGFRY